MAEAGDILEEFLMRVTIGLFLALTLLIGCQPLKPGGAVAPDPSHMVVPADWADLVLSAVKEKYPAKEIRIFFIAPPREAKLRYHYWTETHFSGLAGLAVVRSVGAEGSLFGGETGPWQVVYLFGPDGQVNFLSGRLDWIDVTPPLYVLEVVDQTPVNAIRLARPEGLDTATQEALYKFMAQPFEELTQKNIFP
jgi:hypothetical protein